MIDRNTTELSIGREAVVSLGAKVIQAGLGFVGIIVFTRILGNEGLGRYRTVMAAAFIILTISEDIAAVVKKRVAEVESESVEYLIVGLVVHGGVTAVTMLGLFLAKSRAILYFGSVELVTGVGVITASVGLFSVLNYYQAGIGYPARSTWVDALRSALTLGFQVGLLILGYQEFGVIMGLAIASIISAVFVWASIRPSSVAPTIKTAQRIFSYARYSVPSSLVNGLYQRADPLLINVFTGAGAVGFYSLASQLTQMGTLFGSSVSSTLTVKSSGVDSIGGDIRRDLVNSASYIGLIAVPILFGALAIPDALMQANLFGTTYNDAPGAVLIGIAVIQVINVYQKPFASAISGSDRPDINFRVNFYVALLYAPAAVGLGAVYGLFGVIAGTVIAESVRLVAYQFIATRLFGGAVFPRPVGHQLLAGGVMFAVIEELSRLVNLNRLTLLGSVIGIGAVVYFSTLLVVSQHFRKTLVRTLNEFY
jgi:O-antigen/teichoic acid export membrane protein